MLCVSVCLCVFDKGAASSTAYLKLHHLWLGLLYCVCVWCVCSSLEFEALPSKTPNSPTSGGSGGIGISKPEESHRAWKTIDRLQTIFQNLCLIFISTKLLVVCFTVLFACVFFQVWSLRFFCSSADNTGRAWQARTRGSNIINLRGTLRRE